MFFSCVFVLFTLEFVSPYLLHLGCTLGQVMSILILSADNWYLAIIGSKAVFTPTLNILKDL